MPELKDIQRIYFLGIGGIGMSAIARYFLRNGVQVAGYDKTVTPLTDQLIHEGANIHFTDDITQLDSDADLVVYTPAIPADHAEMNWYKANGYSVVKRSDVLQIITADTFNICVGGTHGKTSISTLIGHVLRHSGYGCNAFLGGIAVNYGTNFWPSHNHVAVVEADEFDRSFLKLSPDVAVITSMDADHLDIYGTEAAMREAFLQFAERIRPGGLLIYKNGLQQLENYSNAEKISYAIDDDNTGAKDLAGTAQVRAFNIKTTTEGGYRFDAALPDGLLEGLYMPVGGLHNVENALPAIVAARRLGISDELIRHSIAAFKGVKRRFEYVINAITDQGKHLVVIDDYAHHPEELRALLTSARDLFPVLKMTVVFQPHLFTRTRDHAESFGRVLSQADSVVLLPVYPAREKPIAGVSSDLIANHIPAHKVQVLNREECFEQISSLQDGLIIIAGAGDIDTMVKPIQQTFRQLIRH